MRNLSQLSGPWVGFWVQRGFRGSMSLGLSFGSGVVQGSGHDLIGTFVLSGTYGEDGVVQMTKAYAWHTVAYKGTWDGQMISGFWKIRHEGTGAFEIWPESDSLAVSELLESETLESVGV